MDENKTLLNSSFWAKFYDFLKKIILSFFTEAVQKDLTGTQSSVKKP